MESHAGPELGGVGDALADVVELIEELLIPLLVRIVDIDIVDAPLPDMVDGVHEDTVEEDIGAEDDELLELEDDLVDIEVRLELDDVPPYGSGMLVGSPSSSLMVEVGISSSSLIVDVGMSS